MTYGLVIASYKYGHLAAQAIESALSQTKKFDKIWFVDDGAGDCKHLQAIYPEVHYVLRETNVGTVANFQDMLDRVDTDYVMFMGADNWLRDDTLEELSRHSHDIIMYDIMVTGELAAHWVKEKLGKLAKTTNGYYWSRKNGHHGSMLYKVSKAKEVGGYSEGRTGQNSLEDMFLYNKMLKAGATITHTEVPYLYYRRHRENYNPC